MPVFVSMITLYFQVLVNIHKVQACSVFSSGVLGVWLKLTSACL